LKKQLPIELRWQRISDARRFFEILQHPDFIYFPVSPKSIAAEKVFLRLNAEKRRKGTEFNFAIMLRGRVVGAIGIKIDQQRKYIGEIGYFVDRQYWGRGIAAAAVKLAERYAIEHLKPKRLEILSLKPNQASRRVAEKCGYRKEGIQRGKILHHGKYEDAVLYAKIV
jgi:ribosomal-protein-alanine N-acetyltransferase